MVLCVFAWSKGQVGRSVVIGYFLVVSKRRSVVNRCVFHVFALSKGRNVVNSCVCVFLHGRRADMSKSVVFLFVLTRSKGAMSKSVVLFLMFSGKMEKCSVFCVFVVFCVFLLGRMGKMSKSLVFVEMCRVFVVFWVKSLAGPPEPSAQPII